MITFIQKLIVLWEKKKFLTLMELESSYLEITHGEILNRDTDALRASLGEIRAKANPNSEDKRKAITIESEINETEKVRQMIQSSEEKGNDLRQQIVFYKMVLWK